jgi:hypothetical protein
MSYTDRCAHAPSLVRMFDRLPHDLVCVVARRAPDGGAALRRACRALRAACGPWTCATVRAVARAKLARGRVARDRFARVRLTCVCAPRACAVAGCGAPRVSFALCGDFVHDALPYCDAHMDAQVLRLLDVYCIGEARGVRVEVPL